MRVSEIFGPTVQGEGRSAGMPCAFLRLALCNLHCIWCDTPHTWNWVGTTFAHPQKFVKKDEVHEMSEDEIIARLDAIGEKALVISGGEPLLQHRQLTSLVRRLKEKGYWVEVETNGTVFPNQELIDLLDQINCSPKLSNSGDTQDLRERPDVLHSLSACSKVNFKFVIVDPQDMEEVLELVRKYQFKEVRLMPEARTKEELLEKGLWVRQLCGQHGFIFCTRLSVMMSDSDRGV